MVKTFPKQPQKRGKTKKMIMNNHRITIREVADGLSISIGSCH